MDMNDDKNHLYELVNDFEVAMLVTQTANAMHARPMAIASLDEAMGGYLVTALNSIKVDEIIASPHALLTFQSARKFCVGARAPALTL
jgi:general stress protein 26